MTDAQLLAREPWQLTRAEANAFCDRIQQIHDEVTAANPPPKSGPNRIQAIRDNAKVSAGKMIAEFPSLLLPSEDYPFTCGNARYGQIVSHRHSVWIALKENKPIPAEVMADYPDMNTTPFPAAKSQTPE